VNELCDYLYNVGSFFAEKNSVSTANTTHLTLFMEITGVVCEHQAERIHCAKRMYMQNKRCSLCYTPLILGFKICNCLSIWPRGPRSRSAVTRLLGLWVQIPPGECLLWVLCVVR